jgi:predicted CXXCH cytochrome family protein
MKTLLIVTIALLVAGCSESTPSLTEAQQHSIELARADHVPSYGAPPMMPAEHPVVVFDDFESVSNGGETCLDCHGDPDNEEATLTTHPERNNCVQCHIAVTAETATDQDFRVENTFEKYIPATQ